ncbi:unnamed protein product [Leptidea sinapis]|uniref:Uncharacterized protein n=1 Tax=Leptidea sinapis TaxID=189913 RepID=A0A5E4Q719_9NEOP|nr:unnamed protein product [Leptidea sinapis]
MLNHTNHWLNNFVLQLYKRLNPGGKQNKRYRVRDPQHGIQVFYSRILYVYVTEGMVHLFSCVLNTYIFNQDKITLKRNFDENKKRLLLYVIFSFNRISRSFDDIISRINCMPLEAAAEGDVPVVIGRRPGQRRVHTNIALVPREGPVHDASLHGLRNAFIALFDTLERDRGGYDLRGDVEEGLRGARPATSARRTRRHRARSAAGSGLTRSLPAARGREARAPLPPCPSPPRGDVRPDSALQ